MNRQAGDADIPLGFDRTLVLVGLMGAGKTTVGRRLATRLGLPFIDADAEIEAAAGCSINDVFDYHGEEAFRDGERRVIARLLAQPAHVLATGGGAYMDPETRARIRERCISIWLRADMATLLKRVKRRDTRPLLRTGDPEKMLEKLIEERYATYAEADITVESGDGPHADVVNAIVEELGRYLRSEAGTRGGVTEGDIRS